MTTVLTVLRRGGEYKDEHVERLRKQISPYTESFVCLDDESFDGDWPKWWAKLNVFLQPGPCLYFDLDTTIVGDITPMLDAAKEYPFIALRNPMAGVPMGSGIMAWNGEMRYLYEYFSLRPEFYMERFNKLPQIGDQAFIHKFKHEETTFWQDLFPGQILSYKVECRESVPEDAMVVYFHGKPRPWDVGQ